MSICYSLTYYENYLCQRTHNKLLKSTDSFLSAAHVQLGCAAALLCVEDKFCTLDGTISTEPVSLTQKQLLRRVPLSVSKQTKTT